MIKHDVVHKIKTVFRAFRYRNYRLFFAGQGISLIGTWMQQVALGWYVYRVTQSPFMLGLVTFCQQIPSFVMPPFAGVLADRYDKKRILLVTQTLSMVQASALAAVIYFNGGIHLIIVLVVFLGCINAVDAPVRQSFVINLVDGRADLGNAIALNSAMFNTARLVGPSIAGFMIARFGENLCMAMNAVSFIAVICSLAAITYHFVPSTDHRTDIRENFVSGFRYVNNDVSIRYALIHLMIISSMGFSYVSLLPVVVKEVLHGDAHMLGFLYGGAGFGALSAALYLASRKSVRGLVRLIRIMSMMLGIVFIAFSFSKQFYFSMAGVVLIGMCLLLSSGSSNMVVQTIVDERMRGRVMSVYMIAFIGCSPFGSLFLGWLTGVIGIRYVFVFTGVCCILASLFLYSRRHEVRKAIIPAYKRLGIIPENE